MCNRGRFPAVSTLYWWRDRHPAFAEALAQAREIAAERDGGPTAADAGQLKGLLMAEDPGRGRGGKIVQVRYGAAVTQKICERIAAGDLWRRIAGRDGLPSQASFYRWRKLHPEFAAAVEEARRYAAEARFDAALEVAEAATAATVQADKLRVSTLLHQAERLDPDRFGPPSGARRGAGGRVRRIVIRRFERGRRDDGTEYVRAIDSIQEREDEP
jgi:hypothetical protein